MKKRRRIKWDNVLIIAVPIIVLIVLTWSIIMLDIEEKKHIERVSKKCASQGYGIKLVYTSTGDEFYVCNEQ